MQFIARRGWYTLSEAKKFARITHYEQVLMTLQKQSPNSCIPISIGAMKKIAMVTRTKSRYGDLTAIQAVEIARNHPFVLIGSGITGEGTNYVGHHAIIVLEIDDAGDACIIDLDDTVKGTQPDQFVRIEPIKELMTKFVPDREKPADSDGSADLPRESVVEPGGSGSSDCVIL